MQQTNSTDMMEEKKDKKIFKRKIDKRIAIGGAILTVAVLIGGFAYWKSVSGKVYIEKGEIYAPQIDLSAKSGGTLENLLVKEGDSVLQNQPVAQIGDEIVRSREDGLVIRVQDKIGKNFAPNEAVVSIIKPSDLRVLGTLEEDKGLKDIAVGQRVVFTADAFGSKEYQGFVDQVGPASKDKGVAFSISDKRALSDFVIKVRFNNEAYSELKDGMSTKIWVNTK